ncbi:MAG: shikimate kinase [Bacteroidales bacterium]|nr:shikimate kinase [Bacteroidales bacterium]
MKIFLVGFMGSGKTTAGRQLAELLGFDFVDTDRFIEMQQGITVTEIFAQRGETAFRDMERNVLLDLQKHEYVVVSTGGGMPCHGDNMDMMLASGKVVYLKTSPQALSRRLLRSHTERPLVKGKTGEELQQYIVEKLAEREPFYSRAHVTVQTENFSVEKLLQTLNLTG